METGQGAAGAQQGDSGQQGGEDAGTGPDFGAMQQALTQQGETLESMRDFLQSAPWQQIQDAQGQEGNEGSDADLSMPDLDLGFLDPAVAATMDPAQLETQLQSAIQAQAQAIAQREIASAVGPLQEQMQEQQRNQEVQALIGEFPEMAEEDTAKQVLEASGQLAEMVARSMGQPELAEALAQSPAFWRTTYMAGRAADAAQEESGDVPAPVNLESGAGATPGGGGGDLGDLIVGGGDTGRRGSGVLPF